MLSLCLIINLKDIKKISVDGAIIKSSSKQEVGKNTKQGINIKRLSENVGELLE